MDGKTASASRGSSSIAVGSNIAPNGYYGVSLFLDGQVVYMTVEGARMIADQINAWCDRAAVVNAESGADRPSPVPPVIEMLWNLFVPKDDAPAARPADAMDAGPADGDRISRSILDTERIARETRAERRRERRRQRYAEKMAAKAAKLPKLRAKAKRIARRETARDRAIAST